MASGLASFNARRNVRAPAMMVSTIQGSSITTASITATAITMSTLTGSTMTSNRLTLSTLTVSSINSGAPGVAAYSTFNASSINTSSITVSSITTAPGFNSNISNVIYTSLADSGQTAANLITTGMPATAPTGTVISGSYRATAATGEGRITMRLAYTFVVGTIYNFTFTGMQGSTDLGLRILQYNPGGFSNTEIGQATTLISTTAATISGSFTPSASGVFTGTIIFHFQALSFNPYVNFTTFSMTVGEMNVGIGMSNPIAKLQINQDGNSTANELGSHSMGILSNQGTSGTNRMYMMMDADFTNQCCSIQSIIYGLTVWNLNLNPRGGNVGIGTTNPGAVLHVSDSLTTATSIPLMLFSPNLSTGGIQYLYFGTANSANNSAQLGWTNVGAGSASNYAFLQIFGRANIMTWQASTGNVGIGTTNPTASLHVVTSTTATTSGILSGRYYLSGPGDNQDASGTDFDGPWYGLGWSGIAGLSGYPYVCLAGFAGVALRSSTGFLQLTSAGNVGIGKTNPGYLLDVAGGIQSSGTSKIVIQNTVDGGSTAGIMYWTTGDTNWASYMSTAGAGKSVANATACTGAYGFTAHAIRMRVNNTSTNGFIWENSSESCLMSIRANGDGGGVIGRWGVNMLSPTNWLDTFDGVARTGTHATGRALYATFNGAEYSNGIAEFRHTNGTQGVGIGYAGLYACGANPDQEFHIIAKGTGLINLRSATRLTGAGDNCMTYYGPNATWNSYLVVGAGTNKSGASTAQVISTNGNLHLDAGTNNVIYYGHYTANTHQFFGHIHVAPASYMSFGSTSPFCPIYITYGRSHSWHLYHYLAGNGSGVPYHNAVGTWNVAIWTEQPIVTTVWFGTTSDRRIKKNIQPVGPMLETINKIEIMSFDFIDEPNNKRDECGVIAQQLETVFPNAVDTSAGFVPCYLKFATSQHLVNDDVHILFDYDSTDSQQNFKVGDKIKIHAGQNSDDKDKGSHHVIVKSIIDGGFVIEKWKDYEEDDTVFLHGKEVNDFRNVDKEQLGVLALKGVQELSSMVTTLQAANAATSSQMAALNGTCAVLQSENIQLKSQLTNILARLEALEAR